MNEIERIKEVMTIIKTEHMCSDMDGDCTEQGRVELSSKMIDGKKMFSKYQWTLKVGGYMEGVINYIVGGVLLAGVLWR